MAQSAPLERSKPSPKQIALARDLAARNHAVLPWDVLQNRVAISRWIEGQLLNLKAKPNRATAKQVALATRIARMRHIEVPPECHTSRDLMTQWISNNI